MELLAWANVTGETKDPGSQIMILTDNIRSDESVTKIYTTDEHGNPKRDPAKSKL